MDKYEINILRRNGNWKKVKQDDLLLDTVDQNHLQNKYLDNDTNVDLENNILEGVMAAQSELNIKSTPSFLVDGILVEGNKSIKEFRKIIDEIAIAPQ